MLVGACGEAFARDQLHHFRIGFKPPPQTEVATFKFAYVCVLFLVCTLWFNC